MAATLSLTYELQRLCTKSHVSLTFVAQQTSPKTPHQLFVKYPPTAHVTGSTLPLEIPFAQVALYHLRTAYNAHLKCPALSFLIYPGSTMSRPISNTATTVHFGYLLAIRNKRNGNYLADALAGLYQIAEVTARSWMEVGSGALICSLAAS